jgi:glucan phosphoethanolaminetransferase (alkaline phosphatase superfamily)
MHVMRNGLYAFSGYFFKILPAQFSNHKPQNEYKKYEIQKISHPKNITIILVIGESVNYEHMSIYGYHRKTNVELEKLLDEGLIFRKAISSSTSTKISLPLILNSIREPNNEAMLLSKEANLFKLAKDNGFQTIYISAQESVLSRGIGSNYIDVMTVFENEKELFSNKKDEALIEILDRIKPTDKNFIILHQRNSHSPYEANYSHRKEFKIFDEAVKDHKSYVVNTYDNSIIFNDFLLKKMIDYFKAKWSPFNFFFTSDHGEMLGENELFGHLNFHINATKVPFLYYSDRDDKKFANAIGDNLTHYEICLLIAQKLGFEIINPNFKEGLFFIQGNNHNNVYEILDYYEVIKNNNQVLYNYKKLD